MIRKIIRKIIEESYQELLGENVGDFNYNKTFPVPSDVVNTAKQAMASTGSKLEKAVELASGKVQTFNQIKKLRDFFTSNQENKQDKSWNLHGGDACQKWVESELSKFHDENLRTKSNLRDAGGADAPSNGNNKQRGRKGMGIFDSTLMSTTKGRNNIR
jgi:hypothetical protein